MSKRDFWAGLTSLVIVCGLIGFVVYDTCNPRIRIVRLELKPTVK